MRHPSSFRDPSGYIFIENGFVKRTITPSYFEQYKALKTQGVFEELISNGLLIPHTEISVSDTEIVFEGSELKNLFTGVYIKSRQIVK